MTRLTLNEQTRVARVLLDRSRRTVMARANQSALLRWRFGAPAADNLLIIPQELRASDPSFVSEIELGHFGLDGTVALLNSESPFAVEPPSQNWERELHGFGWLRHLRAANNAEARNTALELVADWRDRFVRRRGVAWEPAVAARRQMSWIVNAPLLLDDVEPAAFDATADSLGDHLIHLSATWASAPDGYPRLLAVTALLMGNLCIAGHDQQLAEAEALFAIELEKQILPDGGHASRNPNVLIELLLDFMPMRQCFATRGRAPPAGFDGAIARMLLMIRFMRLGDGRIARFNGMAAHSIDALSAVLAYDSAPETRLSAAPSSAYARAERGGTIVILDAGPPPPLELACDAHAGCLSFEMSAGAHAIFVNCGGTTPAAREWAPAARATASHNTLCLGGSSSSKLVCHQALEKLLGAPPIRFPDAVSCTLSDRGGGVEIDAVHDGYVQRFGLLHRRCLKLGADGNKLIGHDRIAPQRGQLRLAQDLPFAIHFHLDGDVGCVMSTSNMTVALTLGDGSGWYFSAIGAALSLEESVRYAGVSGPVRGQQIVLRGSTFGETDVHWRVESAEHD